MPVAVDLRRTLPPGPSGPAVLRPGAVFYGSIHSLISPEASTSGTAPWPSPYFAPSSPPSVPVVVPTGSAFQAFSPASASACPPAARHRDADDSSDSDELEDDFPPFCGYTGPFANELSKQIDAESYGRLSPLSQDEVRARTNAIMWHDANNGRKVGGRTVEKYSSRRRRAGKTSQSCHRCKPLSFLVYCGLQYTRHVRSTEHCMCPVCVPLLAALEACFNWYRIENVCRPGCDHWEIINHEFHLSGRDPRSAEELLSCGLQAKDSHTSGMGRPEFLAATYGPCFGVKGAAPTTL